MEHKGLAAVIANYVKKKGKSNINEWITKAAKDYAWQISLLKATHVLKFSNSSSSGSSVNCLDSKIINTDCYLDTTSLKDIIFDVAIDNGAALGAAGFLLCDFEGDSLASAIKRGDYSALAVFAHDKQQLEDWVSGFSRALSDKPLKSHTLAKQLYFPVGDNEYHLLSPLFSSSLAQQFYQRIKGSRFSDEAKAKRNNKFNDKLDVSYTNMAVQFFGGAQHQNVSQLNSSRGGKTFLFASAPPTWRSELKPPLNSKSIFSGEYNRRAWRQAQSFQQYLLSVQRRDSNMDIRKNINAYLDELIDTLFNYAAEVQNLTQFTGWSANANLKRDQQLWLDPYHNDPLFQEERAKGDWQLRIADDFAFWLKRRLKNDQLVFGETERQEWLRLLIRRLRQFEADLPEVSL